MDCPVLVYKSRAGQGTLLSISKNYYSWDKGSCPGNKILFQSRQGINILTLDSGRNILYRSKPMCECDAPECLRLQNSSEQKLPVKLPRVVLEPSKCILRKVLFHISQFDCFLFARDIRHQGHVRHTTQLFGMCEPGMKHCQVEVQQEYFWISFKNHRNIS